MPGSVTRSNLGVARGGKCGVEGVGPIVSVEEIMGAERSRLGPVYEGGVGPRLEDSGVSNVEGVATLSQEQDRACPSLSDHGYSTRWQAEGFKQVRSSLAVPFEWERYGPSSCYTSFAARGECVTAVFTSTRVPV